MKEKYSFKAGDKIFAKVKGFVYWPARVNPIPLDVVIPPSKIPIFFYGTHEVYFISPSSCYPFDEKNKAKWGKPRSRSHFNEGMDEIENNPTLLEYGVDPNAEDYLAQFYEFKRSNGSSVKSDKKTEVVKENVKNTKSKKEPVKRRNASGSSVSTKENKSVKNLKNDRDKSLKDDIEFNDDLNMNDDKDLKEKVEEKEKLIENKEEVENVKVKSEEKSNEITEDLLKLRSRSRSSVKKESMKKTQSTNQNKKSDDSSDSDAVSSDNPNDEDFEPVKKAAKVLTKVSRTSKRTKSEVKLKPATATKKVPKSTPKGKTKIQKESKISNDDDSLSSISSIEDWKEKDEKRKKEHEEALKIANKEELLKEELAIKEASKLARKKSHSKSNMVEEKNNTTTLLEEGVIKVDISEDKNKVGSIIGKEVIVEISIRDIGKNESSTMNNSDELGFNNNHDLNDVSGQQKDSNEQILNKVLDETEIDKVIQNDEGISEEKRPDNMSNENDAPNALKRQEKSLRNRKSKQVKKEKLSLKKLSNNRKRTRLESDESEEESPLMKKRSKLNRSTDSDCEVIVETKKSHNSDYHMMLDKHSVFTDAPGINSVAVDGSLDKVKRLQICNIDIRSSLVLGHEDYSKCLNTFKSLCSMELDVLSLVSVWQLMDTVKKCRRYKRNEAVKSEAQNVYKRFLDIYSKSSEEERLKAQSVLVQCRHNQNLYSDHSVSKTDSSSTSAVNGHSQTPLMPSSVDDMFHIKQTFNSDLKTTNTTSSIGLQSSIIEEKIVVPPSDPPLSPNTQKEKMDEEKMRLLSMDLEAKVCDILNKIEKKSSLMNPINQQSLSHLLPPQKVTDSIIDLPMEWEAPVRDVNRRGQDREKINDDATDDDDDDEDAIVQRIENVPIKMIEVVDQVEEEEEEEDGDEEQGTVSASAGSTSALDWRIQNLFKTSTTASSSGAKEPSQSSSIHNTVSKKPPRPSKLSSSHRTSGRHNLSPPIPRNVPDGETAQQQSLPSSVAPLDPSALEVSPFPLEVRPTTQELAESSLEEGEIVDPSEMEVTESRSNGGTGDSDIYDLLGV